jgi:hypothetical protein
MPTTTPPEQPLSDGMVFTDDPQLVNPQPMAFDAWSPLNNAAAVRIYFGVCSPDCSSVHAIVHETPDAVNIELDMGGRPGTEGHFCTRICGTATLDVPLPSPLGNRKVLSVT